MHTRLTDLLGIRHPILLGGMAGGTDARLVAAVSRAGGLGILGASTLSPEAIEAEVAMIREVTAIGVKHGIATANYGHAGDGNLHVNLLFDSREQREAGESAVAEVIEAAIALGGTITGEHGVGLAKRRFLAREQGAAVIALQRRLKASFDPEDLLNPGKIFPEASG